MSKILDTNRVTRWSSRVEKGHNCWMDIETKLNLPRGVKTTCTMHLCINTSCQRWIPWHATTFPCLACCCSYFHSITNRRPSPWKVYRHIITTVIYQGQIHTRQIRCKSRVLIASVDYFQVKVIKKNLCMQSELIVV